MNIRNFEFEYDKEAQELLSPLMTILKENSDKYFVVPRNNNEIVVYYKGLVLIRLSYNNNKWNISPRDISSSKVGKYDDINETLLKELDGKNIQELNADFDYVKFININKDWIDKYEIQKETILKGEISCKYNNLNNNLLCVDTEYELSNKIIDAKNIKGRYDLVFLEKLNNNKYGILLAELKQDKNACIDVKTGIISHFNDMNNFIEECKSDENKEFYNELIKNFVSNIETRYKLGLCDINISIDEIDRDNIRCATILKMDNIRDKSDYKRLFKEELVKAKEKNEQEEIKINNKISLKKCDINNNVDDDGEYYEDILWNYMNTYHKVYYADDNYNLINII